METEGGFSQGVPEDVAGSASVNVGNGWQVIVGDQFD